MFYDDLANYYHLLFDDWQSAIARQQKVLVQLLADPLSTGPVLDCACGIGTQALGLASVGFVVEASDLSAMAIDRAKVEAAARALVIDFRVDDMRTLASSEPAKYGAVLAFDNALPHLDSDAEVLTALRAMRTTLRPGAVLLISLRDYTPLLQERPAMMPPSFFGEESQRRIVHQVWDWQDERCYVVHLFITRETSDGRWVSQHFTGHYRAILPQELAHCMREVGFNEVRVLSTQETGYYQPVVRAVRP